MNLPLAYSLADVFQTKKWVKNNVFLFIIEICPDRVKMLPVKMLQSANKTCCRIQLYYCTNELSEIRMLTPVKKTKIQSRAETKRTSKAFWKSTNIIYTRLTVQRSASTAWSESDITGIAFVKISIHIPGGRSCVIEFIDVKCQYSNITKYAMSCVYLATARFREIWW